MDMSSRLMRIVLGSCAALVAAAALFPPWTKTTYYPRAPGGLLKTTTSSGYSFVFIPPSSSHQYALYTFAVDYGRLATEVVAVGCIGVAVLLWLRRPRTEHEETHQ